MHAGLMAVNNRYSACIQQHFRLLLRSIDPSTSLLTELSFNDCLTAEELTRVESASTSEKNALLLRTLLSKSTDVLDKFIVLLQSYEQRHVANVLLGNDGAGPMSQEHFDLLREKKNELCRHLSPGIRLLTFLESHRVLTSYDADRIRSKRSDDEKSDELLRILERKPDSAFNGFIDALKHNGQSHIAYILIGEGEAPIEQDKIRLLDMNRCEIAEYLEPVDSGFIDELLSQAAVTQEEYQRVKAESNRYEQSLYLVDIFKRKSSRKFDCFIEALCRTGQSHLAKRILCVNGTVELNGSSSDEELKAVEANVIIDAKTNGSLNSLHEHGIYSTIDKGSIKIRFSCTSPGSLAKLRELYESGEINTLLYESHGRKFSDQGLQSVTVHIQPSEFGAAESSALMTPEHRKLLQSAADKFAPRLMVTRRLLSRLSLCRRRRQAILSESSEEERSRLLFDIVSRQADSAFQQLVDALTDVGYRDAAEFLCKEPSQSRSTATGPPISEFRALAETGVHPTLSSNTQLSPSPPCSPRLKSTSTARASTPKRIYGHTRPFGEEGVRLTLSRLNNKSTQPQLSSVDWFLKKIILEYLIDASSDDTYGKDGMVFILFSQTYASVYGNNSEYDVSPILANLTASF